MKWNVASAVGISVMRRFQPSATPEGERSRLSAGCTGYVLAQMGQQRKTARGLATRRAIFKSSSTLALEA